MKSPRKKEKSLKPSFRENKRYLLTDSRKEDIGKAILDYIGILGYSKAAPVFVGKVLAINRKELDKVKAALLLAGIQVRKVSGTLRGLEN